ncbi:MAG: flagellar basal body-associated protein FliL [Planctomycetota bacterium]|jgi:flagellar basal body-associated protein FliL
MADENDTKKENEDGEAPEGEAERKPKGPAKLLGGVVALVAAGTILAVMAKPSKEEAVPNFQGPAMHTFFIDGEIVGNTLDDNYSRYLKFSPSCSFFAYDLAYPESRRADDHYETLMKETMQFKISQYSLDEVMGPADRESFSAALEEIAEPILFPVHIGKTSTPYQQDADSGLRVGDSQERSGTFRGGFYDHLLKVNEPKKTIQLDDGTPMTFGGKEYDFLVESEDGTKVYVDVSGLVEGFEGEVHVGVMGRIRRMFTGDIISQ